VRKIVTGIATETGRRTGRKSDAQSAAGAVAIPIEVIVEKTAIVEEMTAATVVVTETESAVTTTVTADVEATSVTAGTSTTTKSTTGSRLHFGPIAMQGMLANEMEAEEAARRAGVVTWTRAEGVVTHSDRVTLVVTPRRARARAKIGQSGTHVVPGTSIWRTRRAAGEGERCGTAITTTDRTLEGHAVAGVVLQIVGSMTCSNRSLLQRKEKRSRLLSRWLHASNRTMRKTMMRRNLPRRRRKRRRRLRQTVPNQRAHR